MKRQGTEIRGQRPEQSTRRVKKKGPLSMFCVLVFTLCSVFCLLSSVPAHSQDDLLQFIEKKQKELRVKEEQLEKEDKKLNVLKKDVEEKMTKYAKLLNDLDHKLKEIEKIRGERLDYIVKVYEGMPPEEAAGKLSALDEQTATEIFTKMKSKKAGAVMAYMDARKAASITRLITRIEKKFPGE